MQEFHIHALSEMAGIIAQLQHYESPGELAARLEGIARELRNAFSQPSEGTQTMLDILMRNDQPNYDASSLTKWEWQERQQSEVQTDE